MTVTFSDETQAKKFKSLVDEADNRMPAAKLLEAYGWSGSSAIKWPLTCRRWSRITVSELCWLYLTALAAAPRRRMTAP